MSSWCPPMFDEAPQRYTKRLFLYASDEIAELLRQKYKIRGYVTPDYEYMAHMAWLIGATSAAQALIREIDLVKSAWGRGDEQKTLSLIKVCTPHMISVWVGGIDQQPRLAGDDKGAVDMDRQWNTQSDGEGRPLVYACLLLSKALEACGQRCIDWGKVSFPVESFQQFLDSAVLVEPGLVGDGHRLPAVMNCLEQGVRPVKRYYVMNMEGKAQHSGKP
jgi:hypothetical protein